MTKGRDEILDAYEAARRSLQAMTETQNIEMRVLHWRNAAKYAGLARMKRATTSGEQVAALARLGSGDQLSARW